MKPPQVAFFRTDSGQPEAVIDRDLVIRAGSRLRLALLRGHVAAVLVVDPPESPASASPGPFAPESTGPGNPHLLPASGTEGTSPSRPTAPLSPENRNNV